VAVNDATGDIATCAGPNLHWWTINGDQFAEQMICADARNGILVCVFYEGVGQEWIAKDLLFTAHKEGIVRVRHLISIFDIRFGVDMCGKGSSRGNHLGS
jgi:beige protein homolog 1